MTKKLQNSKALRQKLIRRGHQQVKKYSWSTTAKKTLTVYLVDGLRGDDDLLANASIVDPALPIVEVSPAVLIPRADTETLVEWVIETCQSRNPKWILDIGTGSGNITISFS